MKTSDKRRSSNNKNKLISGKETKLTAVDSSQPKKDLSFFQPEKKEHLQLSFKVSGDYVEMWDMLRSAFEDRGRPQSDAFKECLRLAAFVFYMEPEDVLVKVPESGEASYEPICKYLQLIRPNEESIEPKRVQLGELDENVG